MAQQRGQGPDHYESKGIIPRGIEVSNRKFETLADLIRTSPSAMRSLRKRASYWAATLMDLIETKFKDPDLIDLLLSTKNRPLIITREDFAQCGFTDDDAEGCAFLSSVLESFRDKVQQQRKRRGRRRSNTHQKQSDLVEGAQQLHDNHGPSEISHSRPSESHRRGFNQTAFRATSNHQHNASGSSGESDIARESRRDKSGRDNEGQFTVDSAHTRTRRTHEDDHPIDDSDNEYELDAYRVSSPSGEYERPVASHSIKKTIITASKDREWDPSGLRNGKTPPSSHQAWTDDQSGRALGTTTATTITGPVTPAPVGTAAAASTATREYTKASANKVVKPRSTSTSAPWKESPEVASQRMTTSYAAAYRAIKDSPYSNKPKVIAFKKPVQAANPTTKAISASSFNAWASTSKNAPYGKFGDLGPVTGGDTIMGRSKSWQWPSQPRFASSYQLAFQHPQSKQESLWPGDKEKILDNPSRGNARDLDDDDNESDNLTGKEIKYASSANLTRKPNASGNDDHNPNQVPQRLLITENDPYYGDLTNSAPGYAISIDRSSYVSVEHYYQSMKFRGPEPRLSHRIAQSTEPAAMAAENSYLVRKDWEGEYRVAVMRNALDHKFTQYSDVARRLLETGDREIVVTIKQPSKNHSREVGYSLKREHEYWYGESNRFGKLLMELRQDLLEESKLY